MFSRVVPAVNLAILLFGVGSWSVAAALPLPSQVRLYQGVPSISGGVGEEERACCSREYTVKLTCAATEGHSRGGPAYHDGESGQKGP